MSAPKTYHTTMEDALKHAHDEGWRSVKCHGCAVEGLFGSIHRDTTCPACDTILPRVVEGDAAEVLAALPPEIAAKSIHGFIREVIEHDHKGVTSFAWELEFKSILRGLL